MLTKTSCMRSVSLSLFLSLINTFTMAQQITIAETENYAKQLVAKNILTPAGEKELLTLINQKKIETEHPSTVKQISYTESDLSKETILQFCASAFISAQTLRLSNNMKVERRITPEDTIANTRTFHSMDFMGGNGLRADYIHPKRSTFGLTRTRTLNDFKEIGLIDEKVYNDCYKKLRDCTIRDEGQLLSLMTERSMYYRYYESNKKEQEEYIQQLTDIGILSEPKKNELLQSYQYPQLKSIPEILAYSNRYALIDVSSFEPNPPIIYPFVFEKIKKLINNFDYKDLKIEILEKKESDLIRQDIKLSFISGGNAYTNSFFHDYRKEIYTEGDVKIEPPRIDQDFHKGINKWLTDEESPYRLYVVNMRNSNRSPYGEKKMGLLLLKENEAEKVSSDVYVLSQESFDTRLSKRNIDKLIKDFSAQGFFSHLSKEELDSARQKIAVANIGSIEELLFQFPKTVVVFDWETGNLENPYESLTKQFVNASRGAVAVSNIIDEFKKGWKKAKKVKYGFTMNNRVYEKMLPFDGDWLSPDFMKLFRDSLKDNNIDGDLYYCIDNGQESGYIFLNTRQYNFIKQSYPDLLKD